MKKFLTLFIALAFLTNIANVKASATSDTVRSGAIWELSDPDNDGTGYTASTTGQIDAYDMEVSTSDIVKNWSGTDESLRMKISSWPANQTTPISSVYAQFKVSTVSGSSFNFDTLSFDAIGMSIGSMKTAVYYSTNNDFSDSTELSFSTGNEDNVLSNSEWAHFDIVPDGTVEDGETLYIRFYFWVNNESSVKTGKYLCLKNVEVFGEAIAPEGFTYELPTVTTAALTYLSTTFVTCGGNISTDGGASVTDRGVCWSTSSGPTTDNDKTSDGTGSGSYTSNITGLTKGTTYYFRAYATNSEGTAYGDEFSATTLSEIVVPSVTTSSVSDIMAETADCGGDVTDWGGADVTVRGVCWNTTGTPTISDSFTEDEDGTGDFTSTLYPLNETTTYYVRAYATNSAGTGYGDQVTFTTQTAADDVEVTVATDGSGNYTTIQAAFDDVPDDYTGNYTIYVKPGTYYEKLVLEDDKVNVILRGDNPDSVIIVYDDSADSLNSSGASVGTSGSYSCAINADDFTAYYITFKNTNTTAQAVALRTSGDRQSFYCCKILGYQDTYYTYGLGRTYLKNCFIQGAVDYIFGKATVYFDSCDLKVVRNGAPITAASTDTNSSFGYVFNNCTIKTDTYGYDGNEITGIYLGRPWNGKPRVAYLNCYEPSTVAALGWTNMSSGLDPLFAEYNCSGPGYQPDSRSTNASYPGTVLTDDEAAEYTIENVLSKKTNRDFNIDWMPDTTSYRLSQTITFNAIDTGAIENNTLVLEASASSNLDVTYESSNSDVATVSDGVITIVGEGTTTITALQDGNFLFTAAESVSQALTISSVEDNDDDDNSDDNGSDNSSVKNSDLSAGISLYPNPATDVLHISLNSNEADRIIIMNQLGATLEVIDINSTDMDISLEGYSAGIYFIRIDNNAYRFIVE